MFGTAKRDEQSRADDRANANAKRITVTLILALGLPLLILWAVYARQFRQITDLDAMDVAQVARNIQSGNGFVTSVVRPLATTAQTGLVAQNGTAAAKIVRMKDMIHPPLFAYAESFVFATGASDTKAFIVSALFFLLTIPVLYSLAKSMFNTRVAQLAVFAYVTSLFMTNMVLTSGAATMTGFMFTSLCLVLFRFAQEAQPERGIPDTRRIFMKGALCGLMFALCYLTDYMLLFAFLPVAIFVYVAGKREGKVGLAGFLLVFLVIGGGWMVRNTALTGNPFFGLRALEIGMNTTAHPGLSLYRTTVPQTVLGLLQETKGDLAKKLLQGIQVGYGTLPVLGQPYLVAFFIVGLFYSFRRNGVNALRGMLLASLILVALLGNLFVFQLGSLTAFAPVMLAFAAAFFVRLLSDSGAPDIVAKGVSALAVVLLVIPLGAALVVPTQARVSDHGIETEVGRRVIANAPIVTDRAFETTWYGGRTTIWLPNTEKDIENLDSIYKLKAIYLSPNLLPGARTAENFDDWRGMYVGILQQAVRQPPMYAKFDAGPFKGFALLQGVSDENTIEMLLGNRAVLLLREDAVK